MSSINWTVRLKNRNFWITFIPALLLLVQKVAEALGHPLDLGNLDGQLLAIVNTAFTVLAILGVVTDPTTEGIGDSTRALQYSEPYREKEANTE